MALAHRHRMAPRDRRCHFRDLSSLPGSAAVLGSPVTPIRYTFTAWAVSVVLSICSLVATVPAAAQSTIISFDGTNAYPIGVTPKSFTVGDCDGDGWPDLIAPGQNSNDVTILGGDGTGRFRFVHRNLVITQPTGAACVDFDGDGLIDYAIASRSQGTVTFYRQQPAGTYTAIGSRPGGAQPVSMTRGDVNGDGLPDLVSVSAISQDITVLVTRADGSLPPFATIRVPVPSPNAAAIADFNLDGFPDIAVVGRGSPSAAVLYGDGVGFAPRTDGIASIFVGKGRRPANGLGIAAEDLNQDGKPDIAILSDDGIVTLYAGNGNDSFSLMGAFPVPQDSQSISLADLDGDGLVDLVLANSATNSLQIVSATAPGAFSLPGVASPTLRAFNPLSLAAERTVLRDPGDETSTHVQVVAGDGLARTLVTMEHGELAQFRANAVASVPGEPQAVVLSDVNGDGIGDAVIGVREGRSAVVRVLLGDADGGYRSLPGTSGICGNGVLEGTELCDDGNLKARDGCSKACVPEFSRGIVSMAPVDVNGDAHTDLVVMDGAGQLTVLNGDGEGRFRAVEQHLPRGRRKVGAVVSDLNGDGSVDILMVPRSRRQGTLLLLANDGFGHFTQFPVVSTLRITGPFLLGDFDRNGLPDVAAGYRRGWVVFYSDGTGLLRQGSGMLVPSGLEALAAADFNEDGWLDVIATFASQTMPPLLFPGKDSGEFGTASPLGLPEDLGTPFIVDINEDLHEDVLDCSPLTSPPCRVFYGDGSGQFGTSVESFPTNYFVGRDVRGAGAGDFDRDGVVDLAGISRVDGNIVIIFRDTHGRPASRITMRTGMRPEALGVADLNGDDLLDLIVASEGSRDLSVFVNKGGRTFREPAPVRLPRGVGGAVALAIGDINNDGRPDLAVSQADSNAATPFLNLGGGLAAVSALDSDADPRGIALGNLNGDGTLDIVTANRDSNTFTVLLSTPTAVYTRADYNSAGLEPWGVALTDLDGDGKDDVVIANGKVDPTTTLGSVVTFLNAGDGHFGAPAAVHIRGRETPRSVCTGDFDADGSPDLAVASVESGDIMVLHGDGNGGWRKDERDFPVGQRAISVFCLDADGDGRDDIAFGRKRAGDVGVILTGE